MEQNQVSGDQGVGTRCHRRRSMEPREICETPPMCWRPQVSSVHGHLAIPSGLVCILELLAKEVISHQPANIYSFCYSVLQQQLEQRSGDGNKAPSEICLEEALMESNTVSVTPLSSNLAFNSSHSHVSPSSDVERPFQQMTGGECAGSSSPEHQQKTDSIMKTSSLSPTYEPDASVKVPDESTGADDGADEHVADDWETSDGESNTGRSVVRSQSFPVEISDAKSQFRFLSAGGNVSEGAVTVLSAGAFSETHSPGSNISTRPANCASEDIVNENQVPILEHLNNAQQVFNGAQSTEQNEERCAGVASSNPCREDARLAEKSAESRPISSSSVKSEPVHRAVHTDVTMKRRLSYSDVTTSHTTSPQTNDMDAYTEDKGLLENTSEQFERDCGSIDRGHVCGIVESSAAETVVGNSEIESESTKKEGDISNVPLEKASLVDQTVVDSGNNLEDSEHQQNSPTDQLQDRFEYFPLDNSLAFCSSGTRNYQRQMLARSISETDVFDCYFREREREYALNRELIDSTAPRYHSFHHCSNSIELSTKNETPGAVQDSAECYLTNIPSDMNVNGTEIVRSDNFKVDSLTEEKNHEVALAGPRDITESSNFGYTAGEDPTGAGCKPGVDSDDHTTLTLSGSISEVILDEDIHTPIETPRSPTNVSSLCSDNSEKIYNAAALIQAAFKGWRVRKNIRDRRTALINSPMKSTESECDREMDRELVSHSNVSQTHSLPNLPAPNDVESKSQPCERGTSSLEDYGRANRAAVKIQAVFRGWRIRNPSSQRETNAGVEHKNISNGNSDEVSGCSADVHSSDLLNITCNSCLSSREDETAKSLQSIQSEIVDDLSVSTMESSPASASCQQHQSNKETVAATRIQSVFRGHRVRCSLRAGNDSLVMMENNGDDDPAEVMTKSEDILQGNDVAIPDIPDLTNSGKQQPLGKVERDPSSADTENDSKMVFSEEEETWLRNVRSQITASFQDLRDNVQEALKSVEQTARLASDMKHSLKPDESTQTGDLISVERDNA